MSWEEFVERLGEVARWALTLWQILIVSVLFAALVVAPVVLIRWICTMVAG